MGGGEADLKVIKAPPRLASERWIVASVALSSATAIRVTRARARIVVMHAMRAASLSMFKVDV